MAHDALLFLTGGGEVGALMRRHDWAISPLGPPETWPQSLRSTVSLMLGSKFPMFLAWGPDLGFLYNDAYSEILGDKHPQALGDRFADIWSEIWSDILPFVKTALAGDATWIENLLLVMNRHGYDEETYFTFSYSPAFDDEGHVLGMFCACTETTDRVRADRRLEAERKRHRQMLRHMPGFVGMLSGPDLVYEYVNDAYVAICERTHFVGRTFLQVFPDLEGQPFYEIFAGAFRTGESAVIRGMELRLHGRSEAQYVDFVLEPIRDENDAVVGLFVGGYETTDAYRHGEALRESEAHLRLMVNELNHRVKNSLATVQAIASQSFRASQSFEDAKRQFFGRLITLAKAHDILTEANWTGATLHQVVERTVDPHRGSDHDLFRLEGPHVLLTPKSALALSMAIYELCTNAAKYGALSADQGHVVIVWTVSGEAQAEQRLDLTWREMGGPPVVEPNRKGFGSRLLERGLAAELGGEVTIAYERAGVVCIIDVPLRAV